uniref:IKBKB interacting protein n=1 Tax=Salarias fasciatus TaxID=181472 RepID=A0A672GXY2_SALFA
MLAVAKAVRPWERDPSILWFSPRFLLFPLGFWSFFLPDVRVEGGGNWLQTVSAFSTPFSDGSVFRRNSPPVCVLRLQLAASEDDLREALSTASLAAGLQRDVSALHAAVAAVRTDEGSASRDLQAVNAHFLNVTETWQGRLAAVDADLVALKAESRDGHAGATERVNEAERRARLLAERLEELEDSTRRNARAMERAEEDDAKRAQEQLDWNTKQIHRLEEQVGGLSRGQAELDSQLQDVAPRARECEEHLPQVEEAVRSILRLGGDLSAAEKRLEEVTLQVIGTEDSMLKALNEILQIRQELDVLQAHGSIRKMKSELSVVKEAVRELTMVLRENRVDGGKDSDTPEDEEEEEWEMSELEEPTE